MSQYSIGAIILHCFCNGNERSTAYYAFRPLNLSHINCSRIVKEGLIIIFRTTKYYILSFWEKDHAQN